MNHRNLHNLISEATFGASAAVAVAMIDFARHSFAAMVVLILSVAYCLLWGFVNTRKEW